MLWIYLKTKNAISLFKNKNDYKKSNFYKICFEIIRS